MLTLIKGGRVLDPRKLDGVMDILIKGGIIYGIEPSDKSGGK